jgi:hypothetical protein
LTCSLFLRDNEGRTMIDTLAFFVAATFLFAFTGIIDTGSEKLLTIAEAAKHTKRSFCSVWRWILTGIRAPNGKRVRLEAVKLGRSWMTSTEAVQRFALATTPDLDADPGKAPRSASKREQAAARAEKKLKSLGI